MVWFRNGWENGGFVPLVGLDDNDRVNEFNEIYHVYVNESYVGDKECVAQGDGGPHSIKTYLDAKGFKNFSVYQNGDTVRVETNNDVQERDIRRHLEVYLDIR
jgi:hypothetical protein